MSPIDHVVIITEGNHTFDNYFGGFPRHSSWTGIGPAGYPGLQFRFGARVPCRVKFRIQLFGLHAWNAPALAKGASGDLFEAFDLTAPPRLCLPSLIPK